MTHATIEVQISDKDFDGLLVEINASWDDEAPDGWPLWSRAVAQVRPWHLDEQGSDGTQDATTGERSVTRRSCPDDGACWHECTGSECWRVQWCEPLSGVFPRVCSSVPSFTAGM